MKNKWFKILMFSIFLLAVLTSFVSLKLSDVIENTNADCVDIDGNIYKTVKIGNQTWMAENLRTTRYQDASHIEQYKDAKMWSEANFGAFCFYDNLQNNAKSYGYLYNWYAVNNPKKLAPKGWHIPSEAEWDELFRFLGGDSVAAFKLKSKDLWQAPNKGASNESGFSALPGGYRYNLDGFTDEIHDFNGMGKNAHFWILKEEEGIDAWCVDLFESANSAEKWYYPMSSGFSVRCIKDE